MACHEIAALRIGMMNVLGIKDQSVIEHEKNEIGPEALSHPGPILSLTSANNFEDLIRFFEASLTDLEQKISALQSGDPKIPYYTSLLILTKKVELDLKNSAQSFKTLYLDLEEMHDLVHEIYPA
ncbi:DUF3209 family protein [Leptospira langatensis]|uniref:DUF3209 family protein n=1 Tax=Leptospira langatensis TaxID=2484983 RepID=A0A5F1ZWM9_9LEPT|nr:DUF3209 family protein [Leptospira langatensis]TGJ98436.1 DUF3209 family protein [Leptospira langatensis]TGL43351.1 DUF3209 family protein [Leptospira langatensis]